MTTRSNRMKFGQTRQLLKRQKVNLLPFPKREVANGPLTSLTQFMSRHALEDSWVLCK